MVTVWEKEYVTIRHSSDQKLIWNEWRGFIPSEPLRESMLKACEFIMDNEVELILADYSRLCSPSMEDQVWIANHTAEILRHSKLKRVANLMAQDLFQQIAIESIYEIASKATPLPCESRDFMNKEEALDWLLTE